MKKAALHNLGCKVNAYETEAMQEILEHAGYEIVPFSERADVYVINTCTVTNMADRKSRQMIHRAKAKNRDAVVVAAGCYAQMSPDKLKEDISADIILGNNMKNRLAEVIDDFLREREAGCASYIEEAGSQVYEEMYLSRTAEHTRAFVKVQDGCNQFCSYCIIPYARGRVRSRSRADVLAEVERLAGSGCKEVVLTGIHLSSYGTDSGDSLLGLIRGVHSVDKIQRIRLGSLEPKIVTEDFARELSRLPKICPHFHLSLQSGCDDTLKRMNRRYTTAEYRKGCEILRRYFVHPAVTTDVIVGFPGETEEEFAATKAFLQEIRFYEMHIFKYSRRKGTRADAMEEQVPEQVKAARSRELIALGEQMSREFREYYQGSECEVLLEEQAEIDGEPFYVGYTKEYVRAAAQSGEPLDNRMVFGRLAGLLTPEIFRLEQPRQ